MYVYKHVQLVTSYLTWPTLNSALLLFPSLFLFSFETGSCHTVLTSLDHGPSWPQPQNPPTSNSQGLGFRMSTTCLDLCSLVLNMLFLHFPHLWNCNSILCDSQASAFSVTLISLLPSHVGYAGSSFSLYFQYIFKTRSQSPFLLLPADYHPRCLV